MKDLQESLMHVLRKVKKNTKKKNTDNPPVHITNLLSSRTSLNEYTQHLQVFAPYPAVRGHSYTQSTSQEPYSFLQSSSSNYNTRDVIRDMDTKEQK